MIIDKLYKEKLIHPPKWLPANCHYLAIVGSESYGANIAGSSDKDIQGFCIPPKEDIFPHLKGEISGFGNQHQRFNVWQQHHISTPQAEYDFGVYSIVKFFDLAMNNNPNILDVLCVPTNCVVHATPIGQLVRDNRKLFFHAGCFQKFKGYAFAQMAKIESGSNRSNPKRQETIDRVGYDTKFLMHVVRLALECEQLLLTGDLILNRDSQTLLSVRRGDWTLEQGKKWWEQKERDLETAYANCKVLPHVPDEAAIKELLMNCLEMHYGSLDTVIQKSPSMEMLLNELTSVIGKYKS